MDEVRRFVEVEPTNGDYWRGIVLFGRNVASYKFALAASILQLAEEEREFVALEELASPFARNVCRHVRTMDKQATSPSSRFLDACRAFNRDEIDEAQLVTTTVRLGFNNVIDAFHVVGSGDVPLRFFLDERRGRKPGISLTDASHALVEAGRTGDLSVEVEARWRLVESAWQLNLPRAALAVDYDEATGMLVPARVARRSSITRARDAISGYQKGRCFYCSAPISIADGTVNADVDHFLPHVLQREGAISGLDGVWNLVLACAACNRGPAGKFDQPPAVRYLELLHTRNEWFIGSSHPLKPTIIEQTGTTERARRAFLQAAYDTALTHRPVVPWLAEERGRPSLR